jgi:muramidase (phage lysozyme)
MSPNLKAFLAMIAHSEIGPTLLAASDDGYNVLVGGKLFDSYADHPRRLVDLGRNLKSTAAGRYQILARYFDAYKKTLGLPDFGHAAQDAIAIRMIKEQGALEDVEAGRFDQAVNKCCNIWASLPGAGYGQHENKLADLRSAYSAAGGVVV